METLELQKKVNEIISELDTKYSVKRDGQLSLTQVVEELGELAKTVNSERLRGKKASVAELEDGFSDLFVVYCGLAKVYSIDLEKVMIEKMAKLKTRHGLK